MASVTGVGSDRPESRSLKAPSECIEGGEGAWYSRLHLSLHPSDTLVTAALKS